jgi:predicted nuclease with RNAse H fold
MLLQVLITMYLGIDVGAKCLHCVAIDDAGRIQSVQLSDPAEAVALVSGYASARVVAVDAPSSLSTRPHLADPNPRLSPKFRSARCAEIELNLRHRIAVPWVTPAGPPVPAWMEAGFGVFDAFRGAGVEVIEVYPHAAFRVLCGSRPPRKTTREGTGVRLDALARRGISGDTFPMWSHDGLDALVAAVVARDYANEVAVKATCGHDDSAIWLPANGAPA